MATAGYRSYEALWEGGASAVPPVVVAGYRSYEAFWLGGASGFVAVPPVPPTPVRRIGGGLQQGVFIDGRRRKKLREDEEILILS